MRLAIVTCQGVAPDVYQRNPLKHQVLHVKTVCGRNQMQHHFTLPSSAAKGEPVCHALQIHPAGVCASTCEHLPDTTPNTRMQHVAPALGIAPSM